MLNPCGSRQMKVIYAFIALAVLPSSIAFAGNQLIESQISGSVSVKKRCDSVHVQFVGSHSLTEAIKQDLTRNRVLVTNNRSEATCEVTLRGHSLVKTTNGKITIDDIGSLAEGERAAMKLPSVSAPAPLEKPPGLTTGILHPEKENQASLGVASGSGFFFDMEGQSQAYARKLLAKGFGRDPSMCATENCVSPQLLTQSVSIDIELRSKGQINKGKAIASLSSEWVSLNMLVARSLYLSIEMIRGQK